MKNWIGLLFLLTVLLMIGVNSCQQTGKPYTINQQKCTKCTKCIPACGFHAITLVNDTVRIDSRKCVGCGECALVCPSDAIIEKPGSE